MRAVRALVVVCLVGASLALGASVSRAANVPLTDVSGISAGEWHGCAITDTGGLRCWGFNNAGQLGDGTTTTRSIAVPVIGLGGTVVDMASGGGHNCVLTDAGGVQCWGYNVRGQLGDGSRTIRRTAVDVVGLSSGVEAVVTGYHHSCALLDTGGMKCWGRNRYGQLGDGTTTDRTTPVDVVGLTSGVAAIGAGFDHTCAVMDTGGVKCWGLNERAQLGDNTTVNRSSPVQVVGLTSGASEVSLGWQHTCAAMSGGGAKCWGHNGHGQLGDGSNTRRDIPADVSGLTADLDVISLGYWHSCALTTDGATHCWGLNQSGQIGDGTTVSRNVPTQVIGLDSGVTDLSTGFEHSCVILNGAAQCWGKNQFSQLGDSTTTDRSQPVSVLTDGPAAVPPPEAVFTAPGIGATVSGWADTVIAGGDAGVEVFRFGPAGWSHTTTLTPDDGQPGDEFGTAINLSGRFAVVGAPGADVDGQQDAGLAYVFFQRADGTWEQHARLEAAVPTAGARFGSAVDSSAERFLIIASPGAGLVTVFEPVGPGNLPAITAELTAPGLSTAEAVAAGFGTSVALERSSPIHAAVGAPDEDGMGTVYAYRHDGAAWVFDERLFDNPRALGGQFGESAAIEGSVVIGTAPGSQAITAYARPNSDGDLNYFGRDTSGPGFGVSIGEGNSRAIAGDPAIRAAHIYGAEAGKGVQYGSVTPAGGTPGDGFGESVDIFRMVPYRIGVVGAPGSESVHLFNLEGLSIPEVLPGAVEIVEGDAGTTIAQLPVRLSEPSVRTVIVDWITADYTATEPADYQAASGTVTFPPGVTATTVDITINGDTIDEADETALVSFRNPVGASIDKTATIGGFYGLGFVTILDDDPEPAVIPWIGFGREGDSGLTRLEVPVRLSGPSGREITVDFTTRDLTAVAPDDYLAAEGTVTFPPGATEAVAVIDVVGDTVPELPEALFLSFTNPEGAVMGGFYGLGLGIILDDDWSDD